MTSATAKRERYSRHLLCRSIGLRARKNSRVKVLVIGAGGLDRRQPVLAAAGRRHAGTSITIG